MYFGSIFNTNFTKRYTHFKYPIQVKQQKGLNLKYKFIAASEDTKVEIDWDHPGGILSPGCLHHTCLEIPGTRRLPVLSPIKKNGWWNKKARCHLYCGSGHFDSINIIVNGSNMAHVHGNLINIE